MDEYERRTYQFVELYLFYLLIYLLFHKNGSQAKKFHLSYGSLKMFLTSCEGKPYRGDVNGKKIQIWIKKLKFSI